MSKQYHRPPLNKANLVMSAETIKAAKANPNIKFVMVDNADFSDKTVPANLLGLLFKEDQPGFLAGALAGLLTKTNVIGAVAGLQTVPPVVHYVQGYENGAKYTNPNVKVLKIYQPESGAKDFNDPDWGKQQGVTFIGQKADILFGVGGNTGNGALLAAKEANKMCIGIDVDQFVYSGGPDDQNRERADMGPRPGRGACLLHRQGRPGGPRGRDGARAG